MRLFSHPFARWVAAGLTVVASAWMFRLALAATSSSDPVAYTYETQQGKSFFTVGIRAAAADHAVTPADRHLILLDTSASQSGKYRERGMAAMTALLEELPDSSKVAVYALDVAATPMTEGFVSPAQAEETASGKLADRAPLGATNLAAGLAEAIAAFGEKPAGAVIYIGDGMSAANILQKDELCSLIDSLRSRHIAIHSFAVGPNTDWRLLGVLAQQTGGIVQRDRAKSTPTEAGRKLARATGMPIVYPQALSVGATSELFVGTTPPPLRPDRLTFLPGRGELPQTVVIGVGDQTRTVSIDTANVAHDFAAAQLLAQSAQVSDGLDMPAAGRDLLVVVDQILTANVALQTGTAEGDPPAADEAAIQPPAAIPPAPAVGDEDLLGAQIQRQSVLTQQVTIETNTVIAQARELRQTSPADALNLLKRQAAQLEGAVEIDPQARRQLLRKVREALTVTAGIEEEQQAAFRLRQQRIAQLHAQQRVIERMVLDEEELEELISRVRALMYQGYHGDYEAFEEARVVSRHAVDIRPGNGPATAALFTSTAADQLSKMRRLRTLKAQRFLATLYQVELSHVPFPDEPPVVYPPPEVWWSLTKRRKKYQRISLDNPSPAEKKIREALDSPVRAEFPGIPLRDALRSLATQKDINIVIDDTAIDEEGLTADVQIDLFLSGITLSSALKLMLEPHGLSYAITNEVLMITTETATEEIMSLRIYPVADLVIPIQKMGGGGMMGMRGGMRGGMMGGMRGGMMGGMGGMMGGMGGMMGGMGGMRGGMGGMFSVPANRFPVQRVRPGQPAPQAGELATPIKDDQMRKLLDGILKKQAAARQPTEGIAFASVIDDITAGGDKKK